MKSAQQMHFRLHFFFFNDTATTEIYTLSLHDALPISRRRIPALVRGPLRCGLRDVPRPVHEAAQEEAEDRKSTRLNSSHGYISYAVFCLKKKKKIIYARVVGGATTPQIPARLVKFYQV